MIPRTIIVGCAGQDGQLLAQRFLKEDRPLFGISRTSLDVLNAPMVAHTVRSFFAEEIYYVAAVHHSSEAAPISAVDLYDRSHAVHARGLLNFLEAIRLHRPGCRLFYAASSHVFGPNAPAPQSEMTPLNPEGIYGITKAAGVQLCRHYRAAHGVQASVGILYNHESPLRRPDFVSQKIIRAAVANALGQRVPLTIGNLDATVDWGYAPDYVEAMCRILQLDEADDFIIATGQPHTVQDFVAAAFSRVRLDWRKFVQSDPSILSKPASTLVGDAGKLRHKTGWQPTVDFRRMIDLLLDAEIQRFSQSLKR